MIALRSVGFVAREGSSKNYKNLDYERDLVDVFIPFVSDIGQL